MADQVTLCAVCGKDTLPRRLSQLKRARISTCSKRCGGVAHRKGVDIAEMLRLHAMGLTQRDIGQQLGVGGSFVSASLARQGVLCKTTNRKYHWAWPRTHEMQPELAYWMGFSFADGCAQYRGSGHAECLTIIIHQADAALLYRLAAFVGTDPAAVRLIPPNKVGIYLIQKGLLFFLARWGVVRRKSYAENFVRPQIPEWTLPHFMRGWFDGDGTVVSGTAGACGLRIVGNLPSIFYLVDRLGGLGIRSRWVRRKQAGEPLADIYLNIEAARRFYSVCNGWPRLERKWRQLDLRFGIA